MSEPIDKAAHVSKGGTKGQVWGKKSKTDFDMGWLDGRAINGVAETTQTIGDLLKNALAKGILVALDQFTIRDSVTGLLQKVSWAALQWNLKSVGIGQIITISILLDTPPVTPADSDCYIVGLTPTGLWTGKTNQIAIYNEDALVWAFYAPPTGYDIFDLNTGAVYRWSGTAWLSVSSGGDTLVSEGALINSATEKIVPVDTDMLGLMDSAAANILKKISWANLKIALKTYFDTLYTAKNTAITAGTHTKITYDTKGLVTSGADATTADIADSTDRHYVTDTQLAAIDNVKKNSIGFNVDGYGTTLTAGFKIGLERKVTIRQKIIGWQLSNNNTGLTGSVVFQPTVNGVNVMTGELPTISSGTSASFALVTPIQLEIDDIVNTNVLSCTAFTYLTLTYLTERN